MKQFIFGMLLGCIAGAALMAFAKPTMQKNASLTPDQFMAQQKPIDYDALAAKYGGVAAEPIVHHYEFHTIGLRTWRLDSATGENCLMLTTDADWKKPETMRQSCELLTRWTPVTITPDPVKIDMSTLQPITPDTPPLPPGYTLDSQPTPKNGGR
jgi:hypothetical protein